MIDIKEAAYKRPKSFPTLSPGEIHVWQVLIDCTAANFVSFKNTLPATEVEKIQCFKSKQAKDTSLVSQGALRILLSAYLDIAPQAIKLGRKKKGKPFSIDDTGLYFNLSNSGNVVVIAISRDSEIGIDIEKIRPLQDLEEMINHNFTKNEIKFINSKAEEKQNRFFRFWTIKESYLKAIGEGMRLPPENLEFTIDNHQIKLLSVKGISEPEDWNFKEFKPTNNYVGTITYAQKSSTIKQYEF
jgi:4'-phosphopantetheinyl transferase